MSQRKWPVPLLAAALGLLACHTDPKPPTTRPANIPTAHASTLPIKKEGFDDHTFLALPSREAFSQLSRSGVGGQREVKFLLHPFFGEEAELLYLDSSFYQLHDEWFWFRLLNGQPVKGSGASPASGLRFTSIQEIYDWAKNQESLPLRLSWAEGDRLYSEHFYKVSLSYPRAFGLGTLIYIPARETPAPRPEYWLFDLEYNDAPSYDELVIFFSRLEKSLPPEVAQKLLWVTRSPNQESLARTMREKRLPYFDRTMPYKDLVIPGETEVYSAGVTAGRLRIIKKGQEGLEDVQPYEILLLETIPDALPPVAGLITAVPQTPMAHINILARNRGIPNVYRGGILEDPRLEQLASGHAWVALRAVPPSGFELIPLSEDQFYTWWNFLQKERLSASPVNLKKAPETLRLSDLSLKDVDKLRSLIGGKAAGFLGLLAPGTVTTPLDPMAITVKPYAEHMKSLLPAIEAMLLDYDFTYETRVRYLVLEGLKKFSKRYPSPADQIFSEDFVKSHPEGDLLGDLVRQGGLVKVIRKKPLGRIANLTAALKKQFGHLDPKQGLRFRSSSSIEDIEGFNGAGLYDSNTGYFDTTTKEGEKKKRSIEEAIKRTWASYWGFEAFEERSLENVDHLSGNMAVLVHPNFQDEMELSNGVFTLTLFPPGFQEAAVMELNVQLGAQSVTNPEPGSGALPEVDRVVLRAGEEGWEVKREKPSTLAKPGAFVLSDEALGEIFSQGRAVAEAWLAQQNESLSPAQAKRTLTLDFEFREVAEGWPLLSSGGPLSRRVVIKQARSLEPAPGEIPETLRDAPIPRDVLARASKVVRRTFSTKTFTLTALEIFCDPLLPPDLLCAKTPFLAEVTIEFLQKIPALGAEERDRVTLDHTSLKEVRYYQDKDGEILGVSFQSDPDAPGAFFSGVEITADGRAQIFAGEGKHEGKLGAAPESSTLLSTREAFLLDLFASQ